MMRNEGTSSGGDDGDGGESVVIDAGRRRSSCGYCKSGRRSSISHGLWARSLTIADYQDLLDRGWRRSGCFLYKPEMESTCCPSYTIRLKADRFTPSKEQQRVFRRMQRYVDGFWDGKKQELPHKSEDSQGLSHGDELPSSSKMDYLETNETKSKEEELLDCLSLQIELAIQSLVKSEDLPCDIQYPKDLVKKVSTTKKRRIVEGPGDLLYTSNVSFPIAAIMKKTKPNGPPSDLSPKNIAEKLASALQQLVNLPDFSVKACNGHINFYSLVKEATGEEQNHLVSPSREFSTQHEKNGDDMVPENLQKKKRKLEIHMNRSSFDPEEFDLYRKYQTKVHNDEPDDVTESSYKRFLVDSPLIYIPPTSNNTVPPCGFGSFHQQYRIDGQLIAVGVIDVLPKCLSSKYLFWDPDLAFLSLGKYSALQEINWVKETQHHCPSLEYYYLGYYIHSCPKMRYKAAYSPSELLCPLRYEWVLYDFAKPLLDRTKYAVLSDYANANTQNEALPLITESEKLLELQQHDLENEDSNDSNFSDDELFPETSDEAAIPVENADVGDVLLGLRETHIRYKKLRRRLGPADQAKLDYRLARYMKVVGRQLSERMVYSLI
ncbi:hypothetical protein RND81_03G167000 [Saponaria officinalis]|uniref:Arginyl-tRNA--protein transferase n=1 Tax=Saponaria officinalis TaxID=3572 RepID=A0AAW1M9X0_SAPOF